MALPGVTLEDGTYLGGYVLSYSPDSKETADRELTLSGPINFRAPDSNDDGEGTRLEVGAIAISARRINYLTVSYITREDSSPDGSRPPDPAPEPAPNEQ